MTLDNVKPQTTVMIKAVKGKGLLRRRLLEMGLTPNTKIKVRKVAPMGDPIEVYLRSYVLTLRKEDASKIEVMEVNDD
ncbi:MAG: FeoA family protein [Coprobacillus sp.]